ncbi:hypothetical protein AB0G35_04235 [Streptomyces sp. NPDC021749]|uniref:hypothetical protein n=1 Tax=Streptomyces sp. NPDC021749 TaxID=3154905 RepID=UPI0033CBACCC
MNPFATLLTRGTANALYRALTAALLVLPLLLVTLASVPALVVLPFLPDGSRRADRIIRQLIIWTRSLAARGRA